MRNHRFTLTILLASATLFDVHPILAQFSQQGPKLVATNSRFGAQGESVSLSADGDTAIVGRVHDADLRNDEPGAVQVWTRKGKVWTEQGPKLVGTRAVGEAGQGCSVSLSADGNTAIVGGLRDNGSVGAAWIWTRSGGDWMQQGAKLVGTGAFKQAAQGRAVALSADGNTAIIGGPADDGDSGAAWIWSRDDGVWTQQGAKLVGAGAVRRGRQGTSVALSADGNTAIVGGPGDDNYAGAVWVWTRKAGVWTQQGDKLFGSGAVGTARQGFSVSLSADGNTALVGGETDDHGMGAVWVWTRKGDVWTQQGEKLVGSGAVRKLQKGQPGDPSVCQGYSVSLSADGNTALIGALCDDADVGAAWIWTRAGTVWSQLGSKLVGSDAVGPSWQGGSVSLSGDGRTALVGGAHDNLVLGRPHDNEPVGAAWVFAEPK